MLINFIVTPTKLNGDTRASGHSDSVSGHLQANFSKKPSHFCSQHWSFYCSTYTWRNINLLQLLLILQAVLQYIRTVVIITALLVLSTFRIVSTVCCIGTDHKIAFERGYRIALLNVSKLNRVTSYRLT